MSLWDMLHEDLQTKIIDMKIYMHYCDTMMNKQTNDFLRHHIQNHFKSKGKRLTNLSKANKQDLLQMFKTYNIPEVPWMYISPPIKDKIESNVKFEVGTFRYRFANHVDGMTNNFLLTVNIRKITKCYVFLTVSSQFKNELDKEKLWIERTETSECIRFGEFFIQAANLVLIT